MFDRIVSLSKMGQKADWKVSKRRRDSRENWGYFSTAYSVTLLSFVSPQDEDRSSLAFGRETSVNTLYIYLFIGSLEGSHHLWTFIPK